ncbi:hypothetical protein [Litchfieldia alkalitelluris]|uniref:hypothetical protein n=1 Tax=Litchfieldia alkalitelluris TaxID=304268 RepID=UPI001F26675C|nr:hypothetical protein [Litchfieldia alkalitelluris]
MELPVKKEQRDFLAHLDEEAKEKAQTLIDEAKAELEELGVNIRLWGMKASSSVTE